MESQNNEFFLVPNAPRGETGRHFKEKSVGNELRTKKDRPEHSNHIRKIPDVPQDNAPLVSVIIPSRNAERTIVDCLNSIISQEHRPMEIIVVDAFSTDSTADVARTMGATVVLHDGGRSAQKNWGARFAKGKYLYFVDADCKPDPDVIASCVEAIDTADGVAIKNLDIARDSKLSRLIASRRKILSFDPLNVAVRFVRTEVFDRLGGFDPDLYAGEDVDFHRRFLLHGFKVAHSQAMEWHLGSPVNLTGFLNRNLYYSSNQLKHFSKNPVLSLKRMNPLRAVAAWRKSDAPRSDLPFIIFLGFLSIATLLVAVLLNLPSHESGAEMTHIDSRLQIG